MDEEEKLRHERLEERLACNLIEKHNLKRGPSVSPTRYDQKHDCRFANVYVADGFGSRPKLFAVGTQGQLLRLALT